MQQTITHLRRALAPLYPPEEVQAITRLILEKRFGCSTLDIYMGKGRQFSPSEQQIAQDIVGRLLQNEPIQYILGEADFGSLTFAVQKGVLVPRPETTELVAWIEADYPTPPRRILDIGTGSGCIAITLATRFATTQVTAWDISSVALATAAQNCQRHGVDVQLQKQDLFGVICTDNQYDIIVSNPPYVTLAEQQQMAPNVLQWEPAEALFVPDSDPLVYYRRLAEIGTTLLTPQGAIYVEINQAFGPQTAALFTAHGYAHVELRNDLSGHPRMIKATRR